MTHPPPPPEYRPTDTDTNTDTDTADSASIADCTSDSNSRYKSKAGLIRIWRAFHYSREGLCAAWRHEHAFRQDCLLAIILIPLAFFMPASGIGKALLIASVLLVLILELINSAIEAVVDRISLTHHPLSKRAKDIGSAAVFIGLINVALTWGLVLLG